MISIKKRKPIGLRQRPCSAFKSYSVFFAKIRESFLCAIVRLTSALFPAVYSCKGNVQFRRQHFLTEIQLFAGKFYLVFKFHFSTCLYFYDNNASCENILIQSQPKVNSILRFFVVFFQNLQFFEVFLRNHSSYITKQYHTVYCFISRQPNSKMPSSAENKIIKIGCTFLPFILMRESGMNAKKMMSET